MHEKIPLFSKSHKNPTEIVKIQKDDIVVLEKQDKKTNKVWAKAVTLLLQYVYSESNNQCEGLMINPK